MSGYPVNGRWIASFGTPTTTWYPRGNSSRGLLFETPNGDGLMLARPSVLTSPAAVGSNVTPASVQPIADHGMTPRDGALSVKSYGGAYNAYDSTGTEDLIRNNIQLNTVTDATTTTYTGPDISTYNARYVLVEIDCSTLTGTSYAPEVDWKAQDGTYRSLWSQATAKTSAVNQTIILGLGSAGYVITAGVNGSTAGIAGRSQADSAGSAQLGYAPVPIPPIIRVLITKTAVTGFSAKIDVVLSN